jgi:hypothetical protein
MWAGPAGPLSREDRRKWRICDIAQVKAAAGEHYLSQAKEPTRSSALGLPTALSGRSCVVLDGVVIPAVGPPDSAFGYPNLVKPVALA